MADTETGIKTNISEIKNIGSFRGVEKAIDFEVSRHIALLEKGENTKKETRRWDELKGESILMREKLRQMTIDTRQMATYRQWIYLTR